MWINDFKAFFIKNHEFGGISPLISFCRLSDSKCCKTHWSNAFHKWEKMLSSICMSFGNESVMEINKNSFEKFYENFLWNIFGITKLFDLFGSIPGASVLNVNSQTLNQAAMNISWNLKKIFWNDFINVHQNNFPKSILPDSQKLLAFVITFQAFTCFWNTQRFIFSEAPSLIKNNSQDEVPKLSNNAEVCFNKILPFDQKKLFSLDFPEPQQRNTLLAENVRH